MSMFKFFLILLSAMSIPAIVIGQKQAKKEIEKFAERNWINQNYKLAAEQYEKLLQLEPKNVNYAYKFAVSNFLAGFNVDKSLKYIEPLIGTDKTYEDIPYWIGKMYMSNYQFNDAIDMFNTYLSKLNPNNEQAIDTKKHINMCLSAIQLLNKPVNVQFENLGTNINSSSNEFLPLIPTSEEFLIFTSDKRFDESAKMFDENLYISYQDKDSWTLAKPLSYINTFDPEKGVGLSPDGKTLFVCGHFAKSYSDINVAIQKNKQFKFDPLNNIFSTLGNKLTNGASITEDGKTIYFSAVRNDSYGKSDIYVIKILPNGQWSLPKNLGEIINTKEDEMYPQISPDGKVLYFASQGHNSIGGFDIFVSYFNEITGEWTPPQNLGYPINSPNDEYSIAYSPNKRYAYISTVRKEGFGGSDIYKVTFNDIDAPLTIIKGTLYSKQHNDSSLWKSTFGTPEITIYDNNKNIFGKYLYNFTLNRFVAALPAGNYSISVKCSGFKEYTENLTILDRSLYVPEIERTFTLIK